MNTTLFQSQLNQSQLEAVTYCDGPSLVIAGAGSGKTRVLTYKIAYLLQHGYEPWSILALTFTNKAAREMNERIFKICDGADLRGLWSGTFHSIFARILRMEHEVIGYPQDFTIYDSSDSKSLIKAIVKELQLDDKVYKPNIVAGHISEAKNHLLLPSAYSAESSLLRRDTSEGVGQIHKIYAIYQQRLLAAGAMDFDDLLLNMFLLLRDHPDVRERYINRFRYILVDEYQDTNMAQHKILTLLTTPQSKICVVGDDAQSIYGFRGADITNILTFKEQYPSAKLIKLECNYRSTRNIVEAANCIISNNQSQIPKTVYSAGEEGDPIELFSAETDKEEARKVLSHIVKLRRQADLPYNEIAILYRTNAQSRVLEEALQGAAMPYRIYGGLSFYQRKEIKDVLAYCRLVANPHDEEAFKRIVNYPARGIGATTLQKIQLTAAANGVSMWQVAETPEAYGAAISKGAANKLAAFCELINTLRKEADENSASTVLKSIIRKSGIAVDLTMERSAENKTKQENVDELVGSVQALEKEAFEEEGRNMLNLSEFLSTVSLLTDTDAKDDGQPRITLMTIHAAKGLEFGAVFVTGMEDELFPNANARYNPREMEEERRLFYVAVTRAKRYCFLSYARTRYRYGSLQFCEPSPFLDEIDKAYIHKDHSTSSRSSYHDNRSYEQRQSRGNNFDDFFGTPSEDDFRKAMSGNSSYYGHQRQEAYTTGNCSYRTKRDTTPKQVAPVVPHGFIRTGITRAKTSSTSNAATTSNGAYQIGMRVHHDRFGNGTIVGTEGNNENAKVKVEFDTAGTKNLLVKFAKLRNI